METEMPVSKVSSMRDYCQVVAPFLDSALVSPEALSRIYAITQPLSPFSIAGFECRLADNQSRVDFVAGVHHGTLSIPNKFLKHPVWQDIQRLDQDWNSPTSFLHSRVKNLWLEFDIEGGGQTSEILIPCLFLGFYQDSMREANSLTKLLTYVLSNLLVNQPNSRQLELNLQQCIDNLSKEAFIGDLGIMLSRSTQQVRLHIKGILALEIPRYLKQIGWKRETKKLTRLIKILSKFVDYFTLDLDIGEQIGFQLGLECYFKKQPPNESRWGSFLDYLISEELCNRAKKNALLAWPGITQKDDCLEIWPSNLYMGDAFLAPVAFSLFYRAICHIKVVYHPDLPLSAKAYLEFGHQWIKRDLIENT